MQSKINLLLLLCVIVLCSSQCKKTNIEIPKTELEKLPPITQTGANTFGCLVNGKAWVAQRNDCSVFCDASFKILYDGINGGNLSIKALLIDQSSGINQGISLGFDSTNFKTKFIYNQSTSQSIGFTFINNYVYTRSWDSLVTCTGLINLTKYDLQNGIVSGTFEFSLAKPNSETILVTDGRFDKKL
jgi:hypothetical protein